MEFMEKFGFNPIAKFPYPYTTAPHIRLSSYYK